MILQNDVENFWCGEKFYSSINNNRSGWQQSWPLMRWVSDIVFRFVIGVALCYQALSPFLVGAPLSWNLIGVLRKETVELSCWLHHRIMSWTGLNNKYLKSTNKIKYFPHQRSCQDQMDSCNQFVLMLGWNVDQRKICDYLLPVLHNGWSGGILCEKFAHNLASCSLLCC